MSARLETFRVDSHTGYWSSQPGPKEHDRFWEGLNRGWDDAVMFMDHRFGPQKATSVIGFDSPWVRRRTAEHLQRRGQGPCVWEYGERDNESMCSECLRLPAACVEHGWRQGMAAAGQALMV